MILRRSSRADPCFVLGSALAFALPLGANGPAFAQTPVTSAPVAQVPQSAVPSSAPAPTAPALSETDALKQHDQELDATRAQQRVTADEQLRLKQEIDAIGTDRAALNQQLIDTAGHVRDVEASIDATRARLKPLDEREQEFRTSLDERRSVIVEILAALQRIGRQPPPALLVKPEDALQAVRTAIMLGAVVPEMRAQADALSGDLAELLRVRQDIEAENTRLSGDLDVLAREQLRLNILVDERQQKQAAVEQSLDAQQQQASDLSQKVDNLKDLIAKLEQNLDPAARQTRDQARSIEADATRPDLAALKDPGRMAPAMAFAGDARPPAAAGQRRANSGIWRVRRRRRHPKGIVYRGPCGRRHYRPMRRLGCLRRTVSQLWATLDPECRRRVSCAVSGDGAYFRRSRSVRADR